MGPDPWLRWTGAVALLLTIVILALWKAWVARNIGLVAFSPTDAASAPVPEKPDTFVYSASERPVTRQYVGYFVTVMIVGALAYPLFGAMALIVAQLGLRGALAIPETVETLCMLAPVAAVVALARTRLRIKVGAGLLLFRLAPFHRRYRFIRLSDIVRAEVVRARPKKGFGVSRVFLPFDRSGKLSVTGTHGVALTLRSGQMLTLTCNKPKRLKRAVTNEGTAPFGRAL